tara:strand:- start:746 stop:949 length:204 start_codon:yes stop_codon:yes gene_type:complete
MLSSLPHLIIAVNGLHPTKSAAKIMIGDNRDDRMPAHPRSGGSAARASMRGFPRSEPESARDSIVDM